MGKVQATARVQITVEFAVGGQVWGADCAIEQVHKQAHEKAIEILAQGLSVEGVFRPEEDARRGIKTRAEIIGEPKITAILIERQS